MGGNGANPNEASHPSAKAKASLAHSLCELWLKMLECEAFLSSSVKLIFSGGIPGLEEKRGRKVRIE